jgi:hypothetical protein
VTTPLLELGLAHDADERSVKRAYAARLRTVRPDVDPAGFQALNEVYRQALEWVRRRDAEGPPPIVAYRIADLRVDVDATGEPADPPATATPASFAAPDAPILQVSWLTLPESVAQPPARTEPVDVRWDADAEGDAEVAPAPPPRVAERAALDFDGFFRALVQEASRGDADALRDWLHRQPQLWPLSAKAETARALMPALHATAPPMPERCLEAILAFFDLDHVLSGQNALQLGVLRRHLHVEWLLRQADPRELEAELRAAKPPVNLDAGRARALLSGPFRWLHVLWQALPPYRPTEAAGFVRLIDEARVQSLPPPFDRRRLAFWRAAGDRGRVGPLRVAVTAARLTVLLLLAAMIDGALLASGGMPVMLRLAAMLCIGCTVYYVWTALMQWQGAAQADDRPGPAAWWRLGFIPLLALIAVAFRQALPPDAPDRTSPAAGVAVGMACVAALLAFLRYRRRSGAGTVRWLSGWRLLLLIPALKLLLLLLAAVFVHVEIAAALAFGFWFADLWRERAGLRASLLGTPPHER